MKPKYLSRMNIQNIHISSYKNITEQTLVLSSDKYTTLIGTNGSGKSNWLEAISSIFLGLYMKQPNGFAYNMMYSLNENVYKANNGIIKKDGRKVTDIQQVLPDKVIACYSGEDQRLWNSFYKPHYDKFFNDAVKNVYQEPNMIYINKYHWVLALISLLCSEKPEIKQFISSIFNVEGEIDKSEISVKLDFNTENIGKFKQTDAAKFVGRLQAEEDLRISHIASYEIGARNNNEYCRKLYFYLYLLSLPKINDVNKVSKAINGIDIAINGYNIDSLSEGHKKLILIKFITSIIGTENSLILLDEPDAHTHIASKRDILTSIQECSGQTILTTHSPVFIDMMDFENLRYVEYGGIVDMDRIKAITKIADGSINILEGALIAASKKIIITEGPDDVKHIKAAIMALANIDSQYNKLLNIPIVFQGGAKLVEDYYTSVLESVYDNLEKVIFVFDYDSEGREGVKLITKLAKEKINYLFYYDSYPIPQNTHDFYLEDFYPRTVYPEIVLPNINQEPSFFEMKKCGSLTKSVKDKLQKMIDRGELKGENFNGFSNLEFNL